jgi:hypothetical protein
VVERRWLWALLTVLPAIVVPLAVTGRGPAVAMIVAALVCWRGWLTRPLVALAAAALATVAMIGAVLIRSATVGDRFGVWADSLSGITWLGHGWGSFFGVFPEYAAHLLPGLARVDHAHNLLIETAFDLGPIGVALLGWFFWLLLRRAVSIERLVVISFLVEASFAFPDKLPATAGMVALVAGFIARDLPAWRLSVVDGRIRLCPRDGDQIGAGLDGQPDRGGRVVALRVQIPDGAGPAAIRARWPLS